MSFNEWTSYLVDTAWGVIFGLVGCGVSLMRKGERGLWAVVTQLVAGGFCGWVVYATLDGMSDVPPGWVAAACGVAGSSGGIILDVIQEAFVKKAKGLLNGGEEKEGKTEGE